MHQILSDDELALIATMRGLRDALAVTDAARRTAAAAILLAEIHTISPALANELAVYLQGAATVH